MASDRIKLRMKIGVHEFEAEGPHDLVAAHFETWMRLTAVASPAASGDAGGVHASAIASGHAASAGVGDAEMLKLFTVDTANKSIRLRVTLTGQRRNADAGLMILYAYHKWFPNEEVHAARLQAAMTASGYRLKRLDRALARYLGAGLLRKGGRRKRAIYAVSTQGERHAVAVVRHLLSQS